MAIVRMVQVAIDQVVDMVSMRHRFVAAIWAVDMGRVMAGALVIRRADVWITCRDIQDVLYHRSIGLLMMEVTVVQVVDVPFMLDCSMSAARAMLVVVIGMRVLGAHLFELS